MMHAWTADAWQSSWGIFSAENPDLGGKIGDINAAPDAASRKAARQHRDVSDRNAAVHRQQEGTQARAVCAASSVARDQV